MRKGSKRTTIKDIAKKAGVSGTTVSRYLNKKFEYMSEETKNKVEKVIKDLDYRPSNIARSLKANKSKLIGVVIADIENPFSNQIIKGLTDKAYNLGYSLMISISGNSIDKENDGIERFLDNRVDGLVVNTVGENEKVLKEVKESIPLVLIDRDVRSFDADIITTNNYQMTMDMMDHLIQKKFKSVAFFSEQIKNNSVREIRHQGFADAVEKNPAISGSTYIIDRDNREKTVEQLKDFYQRPGPRVVFAGNGLVQLEVLHIMNEEGYDLEEDFYFCGFDDWLWTKLISSNGITAVAQDSYQLGAKSMETIYELVTSEIDDPAPPRKIEIKGELMTRGSTKIKG